MSRCRGQSDASNGRSDKSRQLTWLDTCLHGALRSTASCPLSSPALLSQCSLLLPGCLAVVLPVLSKASEKSSEPHGQHCTETACGGALQEPGQCGKKEDRRVLHVDAAYTV